MPGERFVVELTAKELEYAAAALDDLHAWNEAPPSPLAGKLRAATQGPVARDDTTEQIEGLKELLEQHRQVLDRRNATIAELVEALRRYDKAAAILSNHDGNNGRGRRVAGDWSRLHEAIRHGRAALREAGLEP